MKRRDGGDKTERKAANETKLRTVTDNETTNVNALRKLAGIGAVGSRVETGAAFQ